MVVSLDKMDEGLFVVVATLLCIELLPAKQVSESPRGGKMYTNSMEGIDAMHTANCTLHTAW